MLGELWPRFITLELALFSFALHSCRSGPLSLAANCASGDSKQQIASHVTLTIARSQEFIYFTNIAAVLSAYLIIVLRLMTLPAYFKI